MTDVSEIKGELDKLSGELIILLLASPAKHADVNKELVKNITTKASGVYVTVNRPYNNIVQIFEKSNVDVNKLLFIDAITETITQNAQKTKQCLYVSSPRHLTDLSIALNNAIDSIKSGEKFLLLDSISILLLHNDPANVIKFVHFTTAKMRAYGAYYFLIASKEGMDANTLNSLTNFSDKVVEIA